MCHYSNPAWSATVIKLQRERPSVPTGPFVVSRMAGVDQPKSPGQIVAGWAFSKVPVIGDLAKDLYHNVNEWRRYRAAQTGQQIAEIVGVEEMYELARENEELAALLVQVLGQLSVRAMRLNEGCLCWLLQMPSRTTKR